MRRNDPGLTGGLIDPSEGGSRFPVTAIAAVFFGVLFGYLACLHGSDMGQQALIAFAVWSVAATFACLMLVWCFKYVFMLIVLVTGAMWWTQSPGFQQAASRMQGVKTDLCGRITYEMPDVDYKQWICS